MQNNYKPTNQVKWDQDILSCVATAALGQALLNIVQVPDNMEEITTPSKCTKVGGGDVTVHLIYGTFI